MKLNLHMPLVEVKLEPDRAKVYWLPEYDESKPLSAQPAQYLGDLVGDYSTSRLIKLIRSRWELPYCPFLIH